MKHSEPLILNKEEFFEGFDNPSLQEKSLELRSPFFRMTTAK